jgi:hypothetical protein
MTHFPFVLLPVIVTVGAVLFPFFWPNKSKFTLDGGGFWFLGCWFYGLIVALIAWIIYAVLK